MALTYKMITIDDVRYIVMTEKGLPTVIDDEQDNKEFGINAIEHYGQIPKLRNEAASNRKSLEAVEAKYAPLKEHEIDPESLGDWLPNAKKAMETIDNIDQKKLIGTEEVAKIKTQAQEKLQTKLDEVTNKYTTKIETLEKSGKEKDGIIFDLKVNDKFYNSKFVKSKLALPPKVAAKYFGDRFKVENEDGKQNVVAYGVDGKRIYSKEDIGATPDFDEALSILVDMDEDRDNLLRGTDASGTGSQHSSTTYKLSDNPWAEKTFNLSKQGEILEADPALAERMKSEAGK